MLLSEFTNKLYKFAILLVAVAVSTHPHVVLSPFHLSYVTVSRPFSLVGILL